MADGVMGTYLGSARYSLSGQPLSQPARREALCALGSAALWSVVGGLLGGAAPARAQPLTGPVPEVESLSIRVITDSFHQVFAQAGRIGSVEVQRMTLPLSDQAPRRSLLNEWGVSVLMHSTRNAETRNVLVDFGYTPEVLLNNMAILGVRAEAIDAMVLTHGHFDHFGGMAGFLESSRSRLKNGVELYLGGEEAFCTREVVAAGRGFNFGVLDRRALQNAGVRVVFSDQPAALAGHLFTTGAIGRAGFEHVTGPTRMSVGVTGGLGCRPDAMPAEKRNAIAVPDDFSHEIAPCALVRNRGLVVVTGCGHRGVINTLRRAMAVAGTRKVHAVMGGFHLQPEKPDYVRQTVAALKEIDPDYVVPMHCTGDLFTQLVEQELSGRLIRCYTGTRLTFG